MNWNRAYLYILGIALLSSGCKRTLEKLPNQAPDTRITPENINLTGDDRLNSVVFLSWFGTDRDGYITGFEISLDNQNWSYTTSNDSIFNFTLTPGSDTTDIEFYVRAIDNEGVKDPQPAYLKIPLKNTPPVAYFVDKGFPVDTTNIVTTFRWGAFDKDGDETIIKAFIKANEGDWLEIDVKEEMISLVPANPSATGTTDAYVYYGSNSVPLSQPLTGLHLNDTNVFYVKVVDFANSESKPDTSATIFIKPKTSDVLFVSGLPDGPAGVYKASLNNVLPSYDAVDFYRNGGENQPAFWTPTFDFLLAHYSTIVFVSDESKFTNSVTGRKDVLLEFAAPSLQYFSNNGGKSLIVNSFTKGQDISGISSTLPIDSLSNSNGQARLYPDSAITSPLGNGYPDLSPTTVLLGITPFYVATDAEEVYIAQLSSVQGWVGPATVGARRIANGNIYQYFFSIQLYLLDTQVSDLDILFDQILNNDFNW